MDSFLAAPAAPAASRAGDKGHANCSG